MKLREQLLEEIRNYITDRGVWSQQYSSECKRRGNDSPITLGEMEAFTFMSMRQEVLFLDRIAKILGDKTEYPIGDPALAWNPGFREIFSNKGELETEEASEK